jgi:hypothetical protein
VSGETGEIQFLASRNFLGFLIYLKFNGCSQTHFFDKIGKVLL